MICEAIVLRSLLNNQCLISGRGLQNDEVLVSERCCSHLYRGEYSKYDSEVVWMAFQHLASILRSDKRQEVESQVRRFMSLVLRNGQIHNEEFLHRYLFEFWNDTTAILGKRPTLQEKFFKCQLESDISKNGQDLLRRLRDLRDAIPDIIGLSGHAAEDIYVVEVKNEPIDDRAIGQMLRYYTVVRGLVDRSMHSSTVTPILIAPTGEMQYWDTIPFHFREFLRIFFWRVEHDGRVNLIDGKSVFRRKCSQRLFLS